MQITRRAAVGAAVAASAISLASTRARAATEIEMFFPVPVQGQLAVEMQRLIGEFNTAHPAVKVTPVYTGSYDETNLKTRAAIAAGHPPAAAIMSANFVREYVIDKAAIPLDSLIGRAGTTPTAFMDTVLAGAGAERDRAGPGVRRAVPELHAAADLQRRRRSSRPGSTPRSRR